MKKQLNELEIVVSHIPLPESEKNETSMRVQNIIKKWYEVHSAKQRNSEEITVN